LAVVLAQNCRVHQVEGQAEAETPKRQALHANKTSKWYVVLCKVQFLADLLKHWLKLALLKEKLDGGGDDEMGSRLFTPVQKTEV